MASIRIYNSLSRRKETLETVEPGKVGIYLCGPTVYDKAHIGHMVGPVIFDCIKRFLVYSGYRVNWVVNITDVDDKLINKANERGISMLEVAAENIVDYTDNLAALGVDQIDSYPRATDCMPEIIAFVEGLVEQGFAYAVDGDVFFDVLRDPGYGKLSNRSIEATQGDGGGAAARKKHSADFALWKSAKAGEPSWPSPWGPGRPGWHIECSAMSKKLLGETFDIHGGGLDLVFPHHENEIAQSECRHGKPMVKYWAHNGLLRRDPSAGKIGGRAERDSATAEPSEDTGGKMSRSKGAGGLADLITRQGGERIRFFLLRTHYRSTVLFSEPAIEEAGAGLETFYRFFKSFRRGTGTDFYDLEFAKTRDASLPSGRGELAERVAACRENFLNAMDDDFNTGGAIGELFELVRALNKHVADHQLESPEGDPEQIELLVAGTRVLRELSAILGIFLAPPAAAAGGGDLLSAAMGVVVELRAEARKAKKFAVADLVRDRLKPLGILIEDRPTGAEWTGGGESSLDGVMALLIELRQSSRAAKDFATADAVRDRLAAIGVAIEDRPTGPEWVRQG